MWTFLLTTLSEVLGQYLDLHISPCPFNAIHFIWRKKPRKAKARRGCAILPHCSTRTSLPVRAGPGPGDAPSAGTLRAGAVTYIANVPNR